MKVRDRLALLSRTVSDGAAVHSLLAWLDTLPPDILITAEGRRRAGVEGPISVHIPKIQRNDDLGSTVELQVESDAQLARFYWEHPGAAWTQPARIRERRDG